MKVTLSDYNKKGVAMINEASSICYGSNPEKNRIAKLVELGHLSTFRFAWFVFKVEEVSRACSHQLVRHPHLNYLQQSQRYCDMSTIEFTLPDSIAPHCPNYEIYDNAIETCKKAYQLLLVGGVPKEDARFILPNATNTSLYISGNLQAWIEFVKLRISPHAQWEIREVANKIKDILTGTIPELEEYFK